jgi:hypothetical protein
MEVIPVRKIKKKKSPDFNIMALFITLGIILLVIGVAVAVKKIADWGAEHQIVKQRVIDVTVRSPIRIEKIEPVIITEIVLPKDMEDLTPVEQKIIDLWGYRDGVVALAIFDCGESRLDQYAVSHTGDLGIAQINWRTWRTTVEERFGYNAGDMFDIDRNLEVAYMIWDRGSGTEGDGKGSWNAWVGFTNGSYTSCFK